MNRLNPRLPLVFDTRELSRRPGSMLEMARTVPAPDDLGDIDVIAIPPGQPIELNCGWSRPWRAVWCLRALPGPDDPPCGGTFPGAVRLRRSCDSPPRGGGRGRR